MTESVDMGDLGDSLSNIALRDDQNYYKPAMSSARQMFNGNDRIVSGRYATGESRIAGFQYHLTPLEIGMYVLLAVFCAAIAIFVASCFVYASK